MLKRVRLLFKSLADQFLWLLKDCMCTCVCAVLYLRCSICRPGPVGASSPVWWSAQIPAGSSSAHHPHRVICSDGPYRQRWGERTSAKIYFSYLKCIVSLWQKCWCTLTVTCNRTFSALNKNPQDVNRGLCWKLPFSQMFCAFLLCWPPFCVACTEHFLHRTRLCSDAFSCCHKARNRISVVNRS